MNVWLSPAYSEIKSTVDHFLAMKVVDLTCGGGSFLRGAFLKLAGKHELLAGLKLSSTILTSYPMFRSGDEGECSWEEYLLDRVIYGVDIDYKAVTIASLTLTLSSLQHRDSNKPLPNLIGRTLIHQNSLMNTVPFEERKQAFAPLKHDIAALRRAKLGHDAAFEAMRIKLQERVAHYADKTLGDQAPLLSAESLEINLPEVFFKADGTLDPCGGFTCVVGNPPWEAWKPNSDEFYSHYDSNYLSLENARLKKQRQSELKLKFPGLEERWNEYSLKMYSGSQFLRDRKNYQYQSWLVDGRRTSSDLNLYKIAVERFYQVLTIAGQMGILVPDNLATDLGSTGLRHLLFEHGQMEEYLSFENRRKIFSEVDGRTKFAVLLMKKEEPAATTFRTFFYEHDLNALNNDAKKLAYDVNDVKKNSELLSLVEPRSQAQLDVYHRMTTKFPLFGETKPFKLGNDFHRTNDSQYFTTDEKSSAYPLYEGKTFEQFTIIEKPKEFATLEGVMKKVDPDQKSWRIAIRSVASSTNKRSVIATLLPPNAVATHSVNIQKNVAETNLYDQLFYVGVLNSYVIDFYLRLLISMNITQSFIKQTPIPKPNMFKNADAIVRLSGTLLRNGKYGDEIYGTLDPSYAKVGVEDSDMLLATLNARVAHEFGLTRNELITLLQTFESPKHKKAVQAEAQRIVDKYDQLSKMGLTNE